jgi:hypothetical protein
LNPAVISTLAVGTYNGNITITLNTGNPVSVPVTLTVSAISQVAINPASLSFFSQIGGGNNVTQQAFTLSTNSPQSMSFGLGVQVDPNPAGAQWLTVNPSGGGIPANGSISITANVSAGSLPAGVYNGSLLVFAPNATPPNQTIPVRLTVSANPLLNVPTAQITFAYQLGTANPPAQTLTPTSTGTALAYTVAFTPTTGGNWLTVTPTSSTTPNPISLVPNPAGLAPGTYTGSLTVTPLNAGNGPQQIAVSLRVSNDPVVTANVNDLRFAYQIGQALPPIQSVRLSSSTGAPLTYVAATTSPWIVLGGQSSGTTDGVFTVQANPAGLAVGSVDGTITITAVNPATGAVVLNSALTIPVRLYVSSTPLLVGSATLLTFTGQVGAASPQAQQLVVTSTSPADQLTFQVAQPQTDNGGNWLFAGPLSGSTPNTLVISVVPSLLSAGAYTGSIRVTATGPGGAAVANSPLVIPVTLTMTQGTLAVTPAALSFTQTAGGPTPATQTLQIATNGPATNYTVTVNAGAIAVTWLVAAPTGGSTPGTVAISVDGSRLSPGTYRGLLTVSAPGVAGSPVTIPVTFTVTGGALAVVPAALTFSAILSAGAAASQAISVTASSGVLNFSASATVTGGGNWLSVTPSSAITPATLTVSANPAGLPPGTYSGSVTISSPGADGSPLSVPVTLNVGATSVRAGVLSHIAAGGDWTTVISLINTSASAVSLTVNLHADDGSALTLPLTSTLQGVTQTPTASSVSATLNPNATLVISMGRQIATTVVGWADVVSSGPVNGYAIFRTTSGGLPSEGTVPLQTQFTSKLVLPYDNTAGFVTGVAIANLSTSGTVTAVMYDQNGTLLGAQSINIPGNGHASFVLPERLPLTAGKQGIVIWQSTGGNGLSGLGLRFSSVGTFTSVPSILSQ